MNEFKVGDIVIGLNGESLYDSATVTAVDGDEMTIVLRDHYDVDKIGKRLTVRAERLKKIFEPLPFDKEVVVRLMQEGKTDEWMKYNLVGADFSEADLDFVDLSHAVLIDANFDHASLRDANLRYTVLVDTVFDYANLECAAFDFARLIRTPFNNAWLRNVSLHFAEFDCDSLDHATGIDIACPETGSFEAYKNVRGKIVHLLIPEYAKRSSATTRKCRASAAKVLDITNLDGSDAHIQKIASGYDENFVYRVGETVEVDNFDECRWHECAPGIHFFITRDEAVKY